MEKIKYDRDELAKMVKRNIDSAQSCDGGACVDPHECIARVFDAPLETLTDLERQLTETLARLNALEFGAAFVRANVSGAAAAFVQADKEYARRFATDDAGGK